MEIIKCKEPQSAGDIVLRALAGATICRRICDWSASLAEAGILTKEKSDSYKMEVLAFSLVGQNFIVS